MIMQDYYGERQKNFGEKCNTFDQLEFMNESLISPSWLESQKKQKYSCKYLNVNINVNIKKY